MLPFKNQSDILRNIEQQRVILLVLIYLCAALDKEDDNVAFQVLQLKFGISGTVLDGHRSYLADHKQCVNIGGTRSTVSYLHPGVPLRSCLDHILLTNMLVLFSNSCPGEDYWVDLSNLLQTNPSHDQMKPLRICYFCIISYPK